MGGSAIFASKPRTGDFEWVDFSFEGLTLNAGYYYHVIFVIVDMSATTFSTVRMDIYSAWQVLTI